MPLKSIVDPLLIEAVRASGTQGAVLDEIAQPIVTATGDTRTPRAVAQRAVTLVRAGTLARRFEYFTPEGSKSMVRRYRYFTPENIRYGDGGVEQGVVTPMPTPDPAPMGGAWPFPSFKWPQ